MHESGSLRPGMLLAGFVAGPIFDSAYALAELYLTLPSPIAIEPVRLLHFILTMMPAVPLGFIAAGVPLVLGGVAMRALAERIEALRPPFAWIAVGALLGFGLAALSGLLDRPSSAFALVATSAACARLCRTSLYWEPALPERRPQYCP